MVGMGVGQQDRCDPATPARRRLENRGEVAVVIRSGIDADHRDIAEEIRVGTPPCEYRRVRCEDAGRRGGQCWSSASCWSPNQREMISGVISVTSIGFALSVA